VTWLRAAVFVLLYASACDPTSAREEVVGSTAPTSEPAPPASEPAPPAAPEPPARVEVLALTASADFACALQRTGTVACWGGRTLVHRYYEHVNGIAYVRGLDDAVAIGSVDHVGCAIRQDGSVVCWGDDHPKWEHQKAKGLLDEVADVRDATALYGGSGLMCAMTASGVWCWGSPVGYAGALVSLGEHRFGPVRATLENVRGLYLGHYPAAYFEDGRVTVWKPDKHKKPRPAYIPAGDYSTFEECLKEVGDDPELRRDCTALVVAENEPPLAPPPEPNALTEVVEVYSDDNVECQVRTAGEVLCTKNFLDFHVELVGLRGARQLAHTNGRIMGIRPGGILVGVAFGGGQEQLAIDDFNDVTAIVSKDDMFVGLRRGRVYEWTSTPQNQRHYKTREITLPTPPRPK
jgi:hypothetical protein